MLFSPSDTPPARPVARWDSTALPEKDQFSSWREACLQHVYAITPERAEGGAAFRGRLETRRIGALDVVDLQCEGHRVARTAEDIRRAPADTYYAYLQLGQAAWFRQGKRQLMATRGDIVLADPNIEFSTGAFGDFDFRVFRVRRAAVDRLLAAPEHLPMLRLPFDSAEGALLRGCLFALWAHGEGLDPRVAGPVTETFVQLMALSAGVAPEFETLTSGAVHEAELGRAVRYIDAHFAEVTLSPRSAAKALGVSIRKLHSLFSTGGQSFGERLAERRLEEARRLLSIPGSRARPIADIAFSVGYGDISTFYRAFRAKWGVTPGEARDGAAARA